MAEGLNRVMLLGTLGADPDLRATPGGQAVMKIRVATNERYKDRDGAWKERTEWHRVTVWGKRGEALAKILANGSAVFVEGRLQTSSYEKNGEKRYSTEVVAENVILTGSRGGERSERRHNAGGAHAAGISEEPEPTGGTGKGDDDIPF